MFVVFGIALVLAGVALLVVLTGRRLGPLRGESRETQRAVRRAIRVGHTDDPRTDVLARRVIRVTPRLRWAKYFYLVMLALSGWLLIVEHDSVREVVQRVAQCALWIAMMVLTEVNRRRLDGYRGLTVRNLP